MPWLTQLSPLSGELPDPGVSPWTCFGTELSWSTPAPPMLTPTPATGLPPELPLPFKGMGLVPQGSVSATLLCHQSCGVEPI